MYKYEISKYNPSFRNEKRKYLKEDWTAIGDIGKSFEGELLTINSYKIVEDRYIEVINLVMEYLEIPILSINNVRRSFSFDRFLEIRKNHRNLYSQDMLGIYTQAKDLDKLDKEKLDSFCRLLLREDIGSEVYFPRRMKVFIGYDFLMGIQTSKSIESLIPSIEQIGLFVEKH
ncbi:hypothetical protein [Gorillibacterium timonense]|uniref:hypothetical protein n=1 Tax=Gorillibacterium timonense TaxID=1689269 RepID=UPI00071E06F3|nr:hypothetical protein [Gorillibacterium timonense]